MAAAIYMNQMLKIRHISSSIFKLVIYSKQSVTSQINTRYTI